MKQLYTLTDIQNEARKSLPKQVLAYFQNGADNQITLKWNISVFDRMYLIPRMLRDMQNMKIKKQLFGKKCLPIGLAPVAMQKLAHQEGQRITSRIANKMNLPLTISTLTTISLQQIDKYCKQNKFLQLYISKNKDLNFHMIKQAQKNNFSGIVVTVDTQVLGNRIGQKKSKFISGKQLPLIDSFKPTNSNSSRQYLWYSRDLSMDWDYIIWLRAQTHLKVILKGLLHHQDIKKAQQCGVNAVWLSNHGGRQLDTVPPPVLFLQQARAIIPQNSQMKLFVDGGIRKGSDVFKCLALGADYVFIGRPIIYGIHFGDEGLQRTIQILIQEFIRTMRLCGVSDINKITREYIMPDTPKL